MTAHRYRVGVLLATTLALAPMVPGVAAQTESPGLAATPEAHELAPLRLGLGFRPSVQFAQFYLAKQAGYYRDAGLDVSIQYFSDPELITLLGQGALDVGTADGTSLIPAVSQGIPLRYGATIYSKFPNVVFSKAERGIDTVAELEGRRVGIPGRFGSSWVMLQALLASEGLSSSDVDIVTYTDFGQGVAVAADQVDAATGFATNEPVQLRLQGVDVNVLRVDDVTPLPGPGLVVGEAALAARRDALRAFTAATLRAMSDITSDPERGLQATFTAVPELASDPTTQRAILDATIDAWHGPLTDAEGLGAIDRAGWQASIDFMRRLPDTVVASPVSADDILTDELLP